MEIYFTGLTSRTMFDFAISAGSKQKERKRERQLQVENSLMAITCKARNILINFESIHSIHSIHSSSQSLKLVAHNSNCQQLLLQCTYSTSRSSIQ